MPKKIEQEDNLPVPEGKELAILTLMTIFVIIGCIACLVLLFLKLPEMIEYFSGYLNERTP